MSDQDQPHAEDPSIDDAAYRRPDYAESFSRESDDDHSDVELTAPIMPTVHDADQPAEADAPAGAAGGDVEDTRPFWPPPGAQQDPEPEVAPDGQAFGDSSRQTQGQYSPAPPVGPEPTRALPPYGAQSAATYDVVGAGSPPPQRPPRGRVPVWLWPAVAALALVVGLAGGFGGAVIWDQVSDESPFGESGRGLEAVDTETTPPLPADNGSIAAVAQKLLPSTVQISAELNGQPGGATGSGFILDRQGHVVTNNHVVAGAAGSESGISILDRNGERYAAELVGRSPVYDLAVLYVPEAEDMEPAALGESATLQIGEGVVALGSPLGLSSTVTSGIVSALDRPVTTGSARDDLSYINAVQTDAAINPGNSGGPLVNLQGQVVGVNSAIATAGGMGEAGNIGVGFAIPVEQVRVTADQILTDGEARYPVIGAQVNTGQSEESGGLVVEVNAGTPAEEAGLEEGDLITAVDGDRVRDGIALIVAIRTHRPGDTIDFTVERDGQEQQIAITLDSEVG